MSPASVALTSLAAARGTVGGVPRGPYASQSPPAGRWRTHDEHVRRPSPADGKAVITVLCEVCPAQVGEEAAREVLAQQVPDAIAVLF